LVEVEPQVRVIRAAVGLAGRIAAAAAAVLVPQV
jgi:hypothetical protein